MHRTQIPAPQCLTERYRPEECAAFVLMRESGDVRLWQATHTRVSGRHHVEHHITVGGAAELSHVSRLESALRGFSLLAPSRPQPESLGGGCEHLSTGGAPAPQVNPTPASE